MDQKFSRNNQEFNIGLSFQQQYHNEFPMSFNANKVRTDHDLFSTTNFKSNGGRKGKMKGKAEKSKDVVHVRAKRGQATDSHSLAERARREKINEKLKCLQDLVPGCYKAMGMAVMLDVIINYVQSLQNQIESLSMKLSVASMHFDANLERESMELVQGTNISCDLPEMGRVMEENFGEPIFTQRSYLDF